MTSMVRVVCLAGAASLMLSNAVAGPLIYGSRNNTICSLSETGEASGCVPVSFTAASMSFAPGTGKLYAVTTGGALVTWDADTHATETVQANFVYHSVAISGAGQMYANVGSSIYALDSSFAATPVGTLPGGTNELAGVTGDGELVGITSGYLFRYSLATAAYSAVDAFAAWSTLASYGGTCPNYYAPMTVEAGAALDAESGSVFHSGNTQCVLVIQGGDGSGSEGGGYNLPPYIDPTNGPRWFRTGLDGTALYSGPETSDQIGWSGLATRTLVPAAEETVPEPAAVALLGGGLVLLYLRKRLSRKQL